MATSCLVRTVRVIGPVAVVVVVVVLPFVGPGRPPIITRDTPATPTITTMTIAINLVLTLLEASNSLIVRSSIEY
jgi:hypothetical protein